MREFRGNTVLTFDKENQSALVVEHMNELNGKHSALAGKESFLHRLCGFRLKMRSPQIDTSHVLRADRAHASGA